MKAAIRNRQGFGKTISSGAINDLDKQIRQLQKLTRSNDQFLAKSLLLIQDVHAVNEALKKLLDQWKKEARHSQGYKYCLRQIDRSVRRSPE